MADKEIEFLQRKFAALGYNTVSDFMRDRRSELTKETVTAIIYRGKKPDLRSLLKLSVDLGLTTDEMTGLLIARGEKQIAKWVAPVEISRGEQEVIEKVRAMKGDKGKLKLVNDLLDNLRG
ncbi:MAG: hypothetical protein FD174_2617 [Geobacteraceae bacterium]|nr:MAG: hypothetical protein FD174_2617 [Geobacteraceae bacterium]